MGHAMCNGAYNVSFVCEFWHHKWNRIMATLFWDDLDLQIQDGRQSHFENQKK